MSAFYFSSNHRCFEIYMCQSNISTLHDLTFMSAGRGEGADLQIDERAPETAIKLRARNHWIFLTLGQFPAMFMATKSGILSQNRILSLTLTKWCNPKLNHAIITPLLTQWKWKRKILPKETYSCKISVVCNDGRSIYILTIGFLSFFVICFSSRSDHVSMWVPCELWAKKTKC